MLVALIIPSGNQIVSITYSTYIKVGAKSLLRMAEFDWHAYGFVVGSEYRRSVLGAMEPGARTPKQIAIVTKLHLSHVSTTLNELANEKVVICLTPELRKGKLFQLTDLGREIVKRLDAIK